MTSAQPPHRPDQGIPMTEDDMHDQVAALQEECLLIMKTKPPGAQQAILDRMRKAKQLVGDLLQITDEPHLTEMLTDELRHINKVIWAYTVETIPENEPS